MADEWRRLAAAREPFTLTLDEDLIDVEAKFLGDADRLAAAVLEYFRDLRCHD